MGVIVAVVFIISAYISVRLYKSNQKNKKRDRDWNEVTSALKFIDEKDFEEMENEDFDNAREIIVDVLERENIHPEKLMAMQGELEFNFVKMVIPNMRDREIASEIEKEEMSHIEKKISNKFNRKVANGVMESLRDYRRLYEMGG